ncbi:siderophore iron transporter [Trichoderma arundinaceum]|uniref:Siderophore iron transporter n=1 Tax=Trichoderma arundinaceum TaxID=490622 RepID=A0A395NPK8_TRIAR|nr:siderophore iron transporter [Trichoderma arundinaceum]
MRSSSPPRIDTQPPLSSHIALAEDENANLLGRHRDSNEDASLDDFNDDESITPFDIQSNNENIDSVTVPWTTTALIFAYIMIWLTYFVEGILSATTGILTPYVTSNFALHSFTPTVGILSSVVGGVTNLTLAKILDIFGRAQGYLFCIILATGGLIMMSVCNSVQAYAAAQVFQTIGNNGILYTLTVFVADTTSLRNRGLVQSIVSSPNLFTSWLAGPISSRFLKGPGWRWAFGLFAILVPFTTLPLFRLLLKNNLITKKVNTIHKNSSDRESDRTILQSFLHYSQQFDAIGLVLLSTGVTLLLVSLNLYALQGWNVLYVVAMSITGGLFLISFAVWERYYSPTTFVSYSLFLDRTILGACILSAILFLSFWCWNSFFSSYLQVVNDLSVENASYVAQLYTVFSVICGIAVGTLIHYTGRFKSVCLYVGMPLSILGLGLMAYSCKSESSIGYIIVSQIVVSTAAGIIMVCDEIAILAAAPNQETAVSLAVLGLFGNIGGAIGLTIAAAIWQNVFRRKLMEFLPAEELPNISKIYADISVQLSYPIGSETRIGIQHAYEDAQLKLLVPATVVWAGGLIAVIMWRNINISKTENKMSAW